MNERQVLMTEIRFHFNEIRKFTSGYGSMPLNSEQEEFYSELQELEELQKDRNYQEILTKLEIAGLREYCYMVRGLSSQLYGNRITIENTSNRTIQNYNARKDTPQKQDSASTSICPKDILELGKDNANTALNAVEKAVENYVGLITGEKGGIEFVADIVKNAVDTYKGYGENFADTFKNVLDTYKGHGEDFAKLVDEGTPDILELGKDNANTALNAVEKAVENYVGLITGEKGGVEFVADTFKNAIDTYKGYGENFAELVEGRTPDILELGKDNANTALNAVKKALENYIGLITGKKGGIEFASDTLKNAIDTYKEYGKNFVKLFDGGTPSIPEGDTGNVAEIVDYVARQIPQGFSEMDYKQFSVDVKKLVQNNNLPEGEIFIHGSRASGKATPTSDIDIIFRVNQNVFDIFVQNRLNSIPKGSRLYKTIQKAAAKQKLSIFDISRDFGRNLHNELIPNSPIKEIDFSIIVEGSPFDKGPFIPLK